MSRSSIQKINSLLKRYEGKANRGTPLSLDEDFQVIVRHVPVHVLESNLASAFGSDDTPRLGHIIEHSLVRAPKRFKRDLAKRLRQMSIAGRRNRADLDEAAGEPSSEKMGEIVSAIAESDSQIFQIIAHEYVKSPKILLDLNADTRAGILTHMARSREDLVGTLEKHESAAPSVEEVIGPGDGLEPEPRPRYAVVKFFDEDGSGTRGTEFSAEQVFQEGHWCQAEVSIGLNPPPNFQTAAPRPIREPLQKSDVDIFVTAESKEFEIEPRVSKLVLPPKGNSTEQAVFRVRPLRHSTTSDDRLRITFRLFYKFNLLQTLEIRCGALPEEHQMLGTEQPPGVKLEYGVQADANDFDAMSPCALHIHIAPDQQQYLMTFTLNRNGIDVFAFTGTLPLSAGELESAIVEIRKSLFHVCSSPTLGTGLEGADWEFPQHLNELATKGCNLWSLLFDPGRGDEMSVIGDWLTKNPLPDKSKVQISIDPRAASFVVSWSVLYDRPCTTGNFSEEGFWGMRYVIEQKPVRNLKLVAPVQRPQQIEIGAMYWNFDETPAQQKYLLDLIADPSKKLSLYLGAPIDEAAKARQCLTESRSDILYFYTHGYTRLPEGGHYGVTIQDFLELYEKLPVDSLTRKAWKYLYERVSEKQYESDESWIELTSGRLLLNNLYKEVIRLPGRPFVILNMCDSAQITPTLSRSFVDFFLTRGSRAVIGTECSMRPVFADWVGKELLQALLKPMSVGDALLQIRRAAAKKRNLLGLAYTLFGSSDAVLLLPE